MLRSRFQPRPLIRGTLQNQSAEISYVREFLDLPEDAAAWMQRLPADREPTQPFPKPLREGFAVEDVWFAYPSADAAQSREPPSRFAGSEPAPQARGTSSPRRRRTARGNRP